MKISRLLGFLVLAVLVGISFSLSPVTAGEHPWNEDEVGGGGGDSVVAGSNGDVGENEDPSDLEETFMGTPMFWWQLIIDPIIDPNDALYTQPNSGSQIESETDGAMR